MIERMRYKKISTSGMLGDGLALIAGAILTLAFAPFEIYPFALLSPAVLLALWLKTSTRRAFLRGWLFGFGFFGTSVYWVYISIHTFGGTPIYFAAIITAAFAAILALFPALNGYFLNRFFPKNNNTKLLCAFPAIWVALEWIRSWIFSGFPWSFLGYSQINSPLKGYAPILSVYGVSFALALCAGLLVNGIRYARQTKYKEMYFNLFLLILIWAAGSVASFISWTKPDGPLIKISLIQGNIPQALKWSPEQVQPTLEQYQKLTEKNWDSRIIIWPEAAIPVPFNNIEDYLSKLGTRALQHHTALISGIPIAAPTDNGYYNAAVVLGDGDGFYLKRHLVPFGEYIPFKNWFGKLFSIMDIPMSDFVAGPYNMKPIVVGNLKIATFICYEIAYPELVLTPDDKIGAILTLSNDAWFGRSIAQAQHLEIGQMRAIEMGRPVIFVSNNGITAFITPTGKVQSIAAQFETKVLTDSIQAYVGKTPWQKYGIDPMLILMIAMVFWAYRYRK